MDEKYKEEIQEFAKNDKTDSYIKEEKYRRASNGEIGLSFIKGGGIRYKAFYDLNHKIA